MRTAIALGLITTAACGGSGKRAEAPSSTGGAAAFDGGQAGGPPLAEVLDGIAVGSSAPSTCFAWSASTRRVVCAVEDSSIQGGATMRIRVLGDGGLDYTYYQHPDGYQFFGMVPEGFDRDAFDDARTALLADTYAPWTFAPVALAPGAEIAVGDVTLRRVREQTGEDGDEMTGVWAVSTDRVERRCGGGWVALALDESSFGNTIEPAEIAVFATPTGALVATATVSWGIEGDHGGATDAVLLPACP